MTEQRNPIETGRQIGFTIFPRFTPRDNSESNRTATTLELMFDLASVVAIAAAANGLSSGLVAGEPIETVTQFLSAFFMIWWSWMNYTWFSSAYDDGTPAFRFLSLIAMFGALMIAAGVPAVYAKQPIIVCLTGFVIMRAVMAIFWFGAAHGDAKHRSTALTYGYGILAMQAFWCIFLLNVTPAAAAYHWLFLLGVIGELLVPVLAERSHRKTTWHRRHIIERHGLLNIIVIGECFIAVSALLVSGNNASPASVGAIAMAILCAAVTYALYGLYFTNEDHLQAETSALALKWGYGHFGIFAAGASLGAGFEVYVSHVPRMSADFATKANLSLVLPIAAYLIFLWLVRDRYCLFGWRRLLLPIGSALIAALPTITLESLLPTAVILIIITLLRRKPQRLLSSQQGTN